LIRFYQDDTKSSLSPVQKNRRLAQLQVVFDYIRENLSQPLVLEELAALVYMSPSYFCTFFRRATGQTPSNIFIRSGSPGHRSAAEHGYQHLRNSRRVRLQ
jgi:AraC family transcriptional regulator